MDGRAGTAKSPLIVQAHVIGALIMRDMTRRRGRTIVGLIALVLRPLFQLCLMMTIFVAIRGRVPLVGNDPYLFWGITLLPYILFVFPMNQVMGSLTQNSSLLYYPIVQPFDVILARSILQIIVSFWVILLFALALILADVDVMPRNLDDGIMAILALIYLSFSMGWLSAVLFRMFAFWGFIKIILVVSMYLTSGVFFLPSALPRQIQEIVWYNPLLHVVEWLRSAYYEGFGYGLLDTTYLFSFATICLLLGLVLEKSVRGWLMEA